MSELAGKLDLISLLTLLLMLVHHTAETSFAGMRRTLQSKKLPNEFCCPRGLSTVQLRGEKGELGVFLAFSTSVVLKF